MPKINKTEFVKSLPDTMSAAEVVKTAKQQGITLTQKYVWGIRAKARLKAGGKSKKPTATAKVAGPKPAATRALAGSSAEKILLAVAAEIGLARAIALLQEQRAMALQFLK